MNRRLRYSLALAITFATIVVTSFGLKFIAPSVQTQFIQRVEASEYADAQFVFSVCENLELDYYDPALLNYPKLLNAGLDGVKEVLKNQGIGFEPRKIDDTAEPNKARQDFEIEFLRAQRMAEQKVNFEINALAFGASQKLLQSLDSSHTAFYLPEQYAKRKLRDSGRDNYFGIGVLMRKLEDEFFYFDRIFAGSPSEKVGLRRFDRLVEIDGKPAGNDINNIVSRVKGEKGTIVKLGIERGGVRMNFEVIRGEVKQQNFQGNIIEKNGKKYAHLILHDFSTGISSKMSDFIRKYRSDINGLILDLRGNPGGYVSELMVVLELLLPQDTLVFIAKHQGATHEYFTRSGSALTRQPVVVLIDDHSASAAEITAAAIKENQRGKVIGVKSSGSVEVGITKPLSFGAGMGIAIRQVFSPRRNAMEKVGVSPDAEVKLSKENIKEGRDVQLEEAINAFK